MMEHKLKTTKRLFTVFVFLLVAGIVTISVFIVHRVIYSSTGINHGFKVQSMDTMKYSRDAAGQALTNPAFQQEINTQMDLVVQSGATHVAIDTPYDEQFIPVLEMWVKAARAHHLSVWFRGNFSGWEGWFSFPSISRTDHVALLQKFLKNHPDLFASGDVFTPCPECENGGPGDPRQTGDKDGYNNFLVQERTVALQQFSKMHKNVSVVTSMNADIARDIITPTVAKQLGGTILIDHYIDSPEKFAADIQSISTKLNANVGIGEFGAPIPDINGDMTQDEQAAFVKSLLDVLYSHNQTIPFVNYWDLKGGSTALILGTSTPTKAYATVREYYAAPAFSGFVTDDLGQKLDGATVTVASTTYSVQTDSSGSFRVFLPSSYRQLSVVKPGFISTIVTIPDTISTTTSEVIALKPTDITLWYRIRVFFLKTLPKAL